MSEFNWENMRELWWELLVDFSPHCAFVIKSEISCARKTISSHVSGSQWQKFCGQTKKERLSIAYCQRVSAWESYN